MLVYRAGSLISLYTSILSLLETPELFLVNISSRQSSFLLKSYWIFFPAEHFIRLVRISGNLPLCIALQWSITYVYHYERFWLLCPVRFNCNTRCSSHLCIFSSFVAVHFTPELCMLVYIGWFKLAIRTLQETGVQPGKSKVWIMTMSVPCWDGTASATGAKVSGNGLKAQDLYSQTVTHKLHMIILFCLLNTTYSVVKP